MVSGLFFNGGRWSEISWLEIKADLILWQSVQTVVWQHGACLLLIVISV